MVSGHVRVVFREGLPNSQPRDRFFFNFVREKTAFVRLLLIVGYIVSNLPLLLQAGLSGPALRLPHLRLG